MYPKTYITIFMFFSVWQKVESEKKTRTKSDKTLDLKMALGFELGGKNLFSVGFANGLEAVSPGRAGMPSIILLEHLASQILTFQIVRCGVFVFTARAV